MYVCLFPVLVPVFKTMPVTGFFGHLNMGTGLVGGVTGALSANEMKFGAFVDLLFTIKFGAFAVFFAL
jgi:hypothetical protein